MSKLCWRTSQKLQTAHTLQVKVGRGLLVAAADFQIDQSLISERRKQGWLLAWSVLQGQSLTDNCEQVGFYFQVLCQTLKGRWPVSLQRAQQPPHTPSGGTGAG